MRAVTLCSAGFRAADDYTPREVNAARARIIELLRLPWHPLGHLLCQHGRTDHHWALVRFRLPWWQFLNPRDAIRLSLGGVLFNRGGRKPVARRSR